MICPNGEAEPGCLLLWGTVSEVCPGAWIAICVAVPLWHQMGGKDDSLSPATLCASTGFLWLAFYRIIVMCTEMHAKKRMSSKTVFCFQWVSLKTTAHLIKDCPSLKKITLQDSRSHDNEGSKTWCYIAIILSRDYWNWDATGWCIIMLFVWSNVLLSHLL